MAKKLKGYVTLGDRTYGPGEELPEDTDTSALDPALFDGGDSADEAHDAAVVSGPGQVGPAETEEEAAEKRREADRVRKATKRAADKKAADDAAALKAAEEAEAKRQAEEETARKAAEQGQGGGS